MLRKKREFADPDVAMQNAPPTTCAIKAKIGQGSGGLPRFEISVNAPVMSAQAALICTALFSNALGRLYRRRTPYRIPQPGRSSNAP